MAPPDETATATREQHLQEMLADFNRDRNGEFDAPLTTYRRVRVPTGAIVAEFSGDRSILYSQGFTGYGGSVLGGISATFAGRTRIKRGLEYKQVVRPVGEHPHTHKDLVSPIVMTPVEALAAFYRKNTQEEAITEDGRITKAPEFLESLVNANDADRKRAQNLLVVLRSERNADFAKIRAARTAEERNAIALEAIQRLVHESDPSDVRLGGPGNYIRIDGVRTPDPRKSMRGLLTGNGEVMQFNFDGQDVGHFRGTIEELELYARAVERNKYAGREDALKVESDPRLLQNGRELSPDLLVSPQAQAAADNATHRAALQVALKRYKKELQDHQQKPKAVTGSGFMSESEIGKGIQEALNDVTDSRIHNRPTTSNPLTNPAPASADTLVRLLELSKTNTYTGRPPTDAELESVNAVIAAYQKPGETILTDQLMDDFARAVDYLAHAKGMLTHTDAEKGTLVLPSSISAGPIPAAAGAIPAFAAPVSSIFNYSSGGTVRLTPPPDPVPATEEPAAPPPDPMPPAAAGGGRRSMLAPAAPGPADPAVVAPKTPTPPPAKKTGPIIPEPGRRRL